MPNKQGVDRKTLRGHGGGRQEGEGGFSTEVALCLGNNNFLFH